MSIREMQFFSLYLIANSMHLNYVYYAYMSGDWVSSLGKELEQVLAVQIV